MTYSLGTVWLDVAPSFDGLQTAAKAAVAKSFAGVGNEVTKPMEQAGEKAGRAGGKRYGNAFGDEIGKTVTKLQKQIGGLSKSLKPDELKKFQSVLRDIQKMDLSKVGNTDAAARDLMRMRADVQGIAKEYDEGSRKFSQSTRNNLGAARETLDQFQTTTANWSATQGRAAMQQEQAQRRLAALQEQAYREDARRTADQETSVRRLAAMQSAAYREREQDERNLANMQTQAAREREQQERRLAAMQSAAANEDQRRIRDRETAWRRLASLQEQATREDTDRTLAGPARNLHAEIKLGLDDTEARHRLEEIRALAQRRLELNIDADGALRVLVQLQAIEHELDTVNRHADRTRRSLAGLGAGSAANSVRLFNGALLATVALGPLLIPALAAMGAGFLGLGAAAAAGLLGVGALVLGFSGIPTALQAMSARQKAQKSSKGTTKGQSPSSQVSDQRAIDDAQKALARAKTSAAAAIAAADKKIATAEQNLTDVEKKAARASADAAEKIATAQQGLADARKQAARATVQAARQTKAAEDSLIDAQTKAWQAQRNLNDARKQAARDLQDMNNQLKDAKLSEQQAQFNVQDAGAAYNAVLEDPQATARERAQAKLAYEQAQQALTEQQIETKRLASDTADANKKGVEGSDAVTAAQQQVVDANKAVQDSVQSLKDAQQAQRDQAVQNARDIAASEAAVASARADARDQQVQNARDINDAEQEVADARAARADTERQNAQSIGDAQLALQRAYQDQALAAQQAATSTGALTTANDNLADAMGKLSPAGQRFATFLFGLKPLLDSLKAAAQESFLPGLQTGLEKLVKTYGPSLVKFVGALGSVLGDLAVEAADLFTSPWWQQFFGMVAKMAPQFLKLLGEIGLNLLTVFAGVMEAFAPLGLLLTKWLAGQAQKLAKWAQDLADSKGFKSFLAYVEKEGPKVAKLLGLIGDVLISALIGLAPYADKLLDFAIGFFGWLDSLSPQTLGTIALAIIGIVGAIQLIAGPLAAIQGVAGLVSALGALGVAAAAAEVSVGAFVAGIAITIGWILLIVAAIAALVVGFIYLWKNNEGFRNFWKALWKDIKAVAKATIDWIVNTAFPALIAAWHWLNEHVFTPIGKALNALWQDIIQPVFNAWVTLLRTIVVPTLQWFYKSIIAPTFKLIWGVIQVFWSIAKVALDAFWQIFKFVIWPIIKWFYKTVIAPYFGFIGSAISAMWKHVKPILSAFGNFVEDTVAPALKRGLDVVGSMWGGLLDMLRAPVRLGIEYVINKGLIAAFNWLAGKIPGMHKIDPVKIPDVLQPGGGSSKNSNNGAKSGAGGTRGRYKDGGVTPGYTPGADVHHFYSPTAGYLDLSGGEGILRPEAVRGLQAQGYSIDGLNAFFTGRRQGFKSGGIFGNIARWGKDRLSDALNLGGDIVSALRHPEKLLAKVVDAGLDKVGAGGIVGDALKAVATAPIKSMVNLVKSAVGANQKNDATKAGSAVAGLGAALVGSGSGSLAGISGYRAMEAVAQALMPGIRVTSDYRPGSVSVTGYPSMHSVGRAVDFGAGGGYSLADIWNKLNQTYGTQSYQLLYSLMGANQIWWDHKRAEPPASIVAQHYNHVHWAVKDGGVLPTLYDTGGDVPPGLSLIANKTRKPEVTLTNKFVEDVRASLASRVESDSPIDLRGAHIGYDPEVLVDLMAKRRRDKQALAGISTAGRSL